jgi:8-oxo-dGTP diphosphatase
MVVNTKTYDPSEFPAFAVTVDVVVLTMAKGRLHVLLVQRGVDPFEGMWAIPGGFKRPDETLDETAQRELNEETGLDGATHVRQFRAYGDPGRDPRMNIVTVAYVAVLQNVGTPAASTDAAAAALIPVEDALSARVPLAFDHATILGDAVDRVRTDLELTGTATSFLPPQFTLAELRNVYEAVWDVRFDAANFRKRVLAEDGWVIATGRRARPGSAGGKPAELYRAGRRWKHGSPLRRRKATP